MDLSWYYKLIFLIVLFLLSAFFSGSEVALFSIDKRKLKSHTGNISIYERYLLSLLEYPRRLLVTILIGNTIVNVAASIIAVSLAMDFSALSGISINILLTLQIILLTILILIFGELIPKVWASKRPVSFAKAAAVPLYWINVILFPLSETLTASIRLLVSKLTLDKSKSAILPEEISELTELGHERGTIVEKEHGLINSIVNFRQVAVHEVMTPRVDIVSVPVESNFNEVLEIITSSGHSRIPVYENNLDKIIGILYAKDLLPYLKDKELGKNSSFPAIVRKTIYIPRTKKISDLMYEFQEKKMHMAIVVDEYGGTAGLITLEDIIEEIIGEVRDEYDKEENIITKVNENSYLVLGKIPFDEFKERLEITASVNDEEFETLGGFILNQAGHIPKEGYSLRLGNRKITVKEVVNKRIKKVLIETIPE